MKKLLEERILVGILVAQLIFVCLGVLSRYVFNWSLSFTEELTRYLLIWLACLGFPACWARDEMIQFHSPWPKPRWMQAALAYGKLVLCGLYLLVVGYAACRLIFTIQVPFHQRTSVMNWPIVWVSAAFPVFCLLFLFRMAWQAIKKPLP